MARGWESKSVEEQQSQFQQTDSKPKKTPEELRRTAKLQSLSLKRARVVEQLRMSRNSRYTELLQQELEDLDRELKTLSA